MLQIHPNAPTTPVTRPEIARSHERTGVLAQRCGVSTGDHPQVAQAWCGRLPGRKLLEMSRSDAPLIIEDASDGCLCVRSLPS